MIVSNLYGKQWNSCNNLCQKYEIYKLEVLVPSAWWASLQVALYLLVLLFYLLWQFSDGYERLIHQSNGKPKKFLFSVTFPSQLVSFKIKIQDHDHFYKNKIRINPASIKSHIITQTFLSIIMCQPKITLINRLIYLNTIFLLNFGSSKGNFGIIDPKWPQNPYNDFQFQVCAYSGRSKCSKSNKILNVQCTFSHFYFSLIFFCQIVQKMTYGRLTTKGSAFLGLFFVAKFFKRGERSQIQTITLRRRRNRSKGSHEGILGFLLINLASCPHWGGCAWLPRSAVTTF